MARVIYGYIDHGPDNEQMSQKFWPEVQPVISSEETFAYDVEAQIVDCLQREEDYLTRLAITQDIKEIISDFQPSGLYLCGSSGNYTGLVDSDLNLCFVTKNQNETMRNKLYILSNMSWVLRSRLRCNMPKVILSGVPRLRFNYSGIDIDMTVNQTSDVRNSDLFMYFSRYDERVRLLIIAVKWWAKKAGISDTSNGGLSSYSLALMVIFNLQQDDVLPKPSPEFYDDIRNSDFMKMRDLALQDESMFNTFRGAYIFSSVRNFFNDFIAFYAYKFDFKKYEVSVRSGRPLDKKNPIRRADGCFRWIYVEDPFELTNTAESVQTADDYVKIMDVFLETLNTIESETYHQCQAEIPKPTSKKSLVWSFFKVTGCWLLIVAFVVGSSKRL